MPDSNHNSVASAPRSEATSWILARLTSTPRHSRAQSMLIVVGLVVLIGSVDYLVGVRVSLQFFYLIPVVISVAWLGWRAGCAIAVCALAARVASDLSAWFG
jgi:hypothetical protein